MPDRPTYRPVYKALHRPLTIWGVDRRLFFLSLLLGAATLVFLLVHLVPGETVRAMISP
jgi:type IV secretory pathway VirB3-like protein